jgi:hypothetical protein
MSLSLRHNGERLEERIRIQRNAVDAAFHHETRELRIVAWSLTADADFPTRTPGSPDNLRHHVLHGRITLIEEGSDQL